MTKTETLSTPQQRAVTVRVLLATALSLTFLVAVRWASDVTQANAKRISHNLVHVGDRMHGEPPVSGFAKPLLESDR